jgi:2-keto-3-deoxy-L-rhamnonate aldolase RhmA
MGLGDSLKERISVNGYLLNGYCAGSDYNARGNESTSVFAMIETAEGMANLDDNGVRRLAEGAKRSAE